MNRRAARRIGAAVWSVPLAIGACAPPSPPTGVVTEGVVVHVVDGDTLELALDGRVERVRLLGVDTPETVHPTQPVECFGPEASARLAALLPAGTPVQVARDEQARDPYDRLLLYVVGPDGVLVNEQLLREGVADVLVIEPNDALADRLHRTAAEARAADAGLWGACGGPHQAAAPGPAAAAVPSPP